MNFNDAIISNINSRNFLRNAIRKTVRPDIYLKIMRQFRETDVSANTEFQKKFTYFYRLRRSSDWLNSYYRVFQDFKTCGNADIKSILTAIAEMPYNNKGLEFSFASKMLATINPDMPIWDLFVKEKLNIAIPPSSNNICARIDAATVAYDRLVEEMQKRLNDPEFNEAIDALDELLPECKEISRMKKLDFLIWGSGD